MGWNESMKQHLSWEANSDSVCLESYINAASYSGQTKIWIPVVLCRDLLFLHWPWSKTVEIDHNSFLSHRQSADISMKWTSIRLHTWLFVISNALWSFNILLCVSKSGSTFLPGFHFVSEWALVREQACVIITGAAKYLLKLISFL